MTGPSAARREASMTAEPASADGIAGVPQSLAGPVLDVRDLRIVRARPGGNDTIVSSVSLAVRPGETIAIVGESGSGKSMTARAITGLLPPGLSARGEVRYAGRNLLGLSERQWQQVRGSQIGLILQDPFTMLNPVARVRRILAESLAHRKLGRAKRQAETARRLAEVGITDPAVMDSYPFQLSGGMRQRVAIAAALARDPRVLIADEPSTALDVETQRQILALIRQVQEDRGMSLILITHDLRVAFTMCERIYVLYAGSLAESGPADALHAEPLHPYTQGLLLSEPPADRRLRELASIAGSVPVPDQVAGGCPFAPRCHWAADVCTQATPRLTEMEPGRLSACVRLPEIRAEMAAMRQRAGQDASPPPPRRVEAPLVQVANVGKTFRTADRVVTALEDVSIEVGANESVGLVGESGSGKTTLARTLVGLEHPTSGTITIDGIPATNWDRLSGRDRRALRGTVQIVFQDPYSSLNPMRTIGSTLGEAIATHAHRAKGRDAHVAELLESVGLPASYARRKPVALSGGERQRIAIARALAASPRVLICDEPVSALDVSVQAQILNLLAALRAERGIGYLFITHDLAVVRQITDQLYVLYRGRIVESGPTERVLTSPQNPYTVKLLGAVPGASVN